GAPLLAVPPVLLGDLVLLPGDALALLESPELLGLVDVQPELDQDDAALDELFLESVDLAVRAGPLVDGGELVDTLDEDAPVPRAIIDGHGTGARDPAPEAPEVMLGALLVGRRGDGDHAIEPRVDRRDQPPDRPSLSRRVRAFEEHDRRSLLVPRPPGQAADLVLQLLELF